MTLVIVTRGVYSAKGVAIDELCLADEGNLNHWTQSGHTIIKANMSANKVVIAACSSLVFDNEVNIKEESIPFVLSTFNALWKADYNVAKLLNCDWPMSEAGHEIIQRQTQNPLTHTNDISQAASTNQSQAAPGTRIKGNYNVRLLYDYEVYIASPSMMFTSLIDIILDYDRHSVWTVYTVLERMFVFPVPAGSQGYDWLNEGIISPKQTINLPIYSVFSPLCNYNFGLVIGYLFVTFATHTELVCFGKPIDRCAPIHV
ncbi:unnamed protein product [Schistocephalus solidus]|uniref:Uncharacterized protein n=1 Tax=Schistocephalus solidus TaxID=70667 RepID=A0A3P7EJI5_SCHSO|nr:unnamed protein product [Schistocephalus solidus]